MSNSTCAARPSSAIHYASRFPESLLRRMEKATVPWGPLGYVTYARTYSRLRQDLGRREEWADTTQRCLQALLDYGMAVTDTELEDLTDAWFNLKAMTAGRGLWQLGTSTVDKVGADSLMNCWFTPLSAPESFCFLFEQLMLGGGVGFTVLASHVYQLPPVRRAVKVTRQDGADVDFIVPDNREGWVDLLRRVLDAFFRTGKDFTYSCHCVRSRGAPISGFGGTASGPDELARGIGRIAGVLSARAGKRARPIDALDIANIIGGIVVAGNVRRSAEIGLGHAEDCHFLSAKRWDGGKIPSWRAMSNNTCVCNDTSGLPEAFWDGYRGNGEPYGLFNLNLCREMGRLADGPDYRPDREIEGVNPCGEQGLAPREGCCLAEIFLPRLRDRADFHKVAGLIYKALKTIICLPFSWPDTQKVVERNRRIGIGATGVAMSRFGSDDYTEVYRHIEESDVAYSKQKGMMPSIKLTTVKPSGTTSLLPGVTPGVHPAYAPYYLRRIRFSSDDPLVDVCRRRGYHTEPALRLDATADQTMAVVDFPVATAKGTLMARDTTAIGQLEMQRSMQTYWSDNAVSVTVYYHPEELPGIRNWLAENYRQSTKSVSFLLHKEHGFLQAPYEEITRERYQQLAALTEPITSLDEKEERELSDLQDCNGACPTR